MNYQTIRVVVLVNTVLVSSAVIAGLTLSVLVISKGDYDRPLATNILMPVIIVGLAFLTLLIVTRRPENRLGIGLSLQSLFIAVLGAADTYAFYGLTVKPGSLPATEVAAWLASWTWVPAVMPLLTLLFLLCPDGRPPTPSWNKVLWAVSINLVVLSVASALKPGPLEGFTQIDNPFGISALGGVIELIGTISIVFLVPSIGLCAAAMVRRFRHARGIERLQLKWFALASVFALGAFVIAWIIGLNSESDAVWDYALVFALGIVTLSTGLAVLRYHLYDIDHIVNRAAVYAVLTAFLGAIYLCAVVGLQALLSGIAGGSDLAIAMTTLIVAALFLPARRAIQSIVDLKFNRSAYDAARTVDAFSSRLREQIDLDTLHHELLTVVEETMQPARASLWLRSGRAR